MQPCYFFEKTFFMRANLVHISVVVACFIFLFIGFPCSTYAQRLKDVSPNYLKTASFDRSGSTQTNPANNILSSELSLADIQFPYDEEKSKTLAGLYSFLLPGLGEAYAGNFSTGKYSFGIEIALVTGLISTIVYANSLETDYQILARNYAGVNSSHKSEQFWKDISNYSSWENFNNERLKQRNYDGLYSEDDYWSWESEEKRKDYRSKRISSDEAYQSAYYFLAAMGLNRLISMINAVRSTAEFNNNLTYNFKLNVSPLLALNRKYIMDGLKISIRKTF